MAKTLQTAAEHPLIKMLLVGDAGTGKTGALACLANAGFRLRILDFDNNLAPLVQNTTDEGKANVTFHTLAERVRFDPKTMKAKMGAKPKAFSRAMEALDNWNMDDSEAPKISAEKDFNEGDIVVLDSLSLFSKTCLNWVMANEGRLGGQPQIQDWGAGGRWVNSFVEALVSDDLGCHVIVITHLRAIELENGAAKFYPRALSTGTDTEVAKYFDTMLLVESVGSGEKVSRRIRTTPTPMFPTKAPFKVPDKMDIKDGLLRYFTSVGANPPGKS